MDWARSDACNGQPDGYAWSVKLEVGDVVVYAPLGVGRVSLREKRLVDGMEREIVVLAAVKYERRHAAVRPV